MAPGLIANECGYNPVAVPDFSNPRFVFEHGTVRSTKASYLRIALDLIESYHDDARMNGRIHRDSEERAVELFTAMS